MLINLMFNIMLNNCFSPVLKVTDSAIGKIPVSK